MRETLRIYLLGAPQIYVGDTAVTGWPSRAAEAVIAYVVSAENPTPRSKLVDLLWPDSDPKQAQGNLRTILSKIRKQLGDYFIIERQTIAIQPDAPIWIDSVELVRTVTADATLKQLTAAADLYRDSFLAGLDLRNAYPFDEWLAIERERLERIAIIALQNLAAGHLQTGHYIKGETYAQRWLALDQFSEDAMQMLLWLQLRQGRRNAALRQYAAFANLLENELDIEPVGATQAVADRARRVTQLGATNLTPAHTPFVGRAAELGELLTHIRQPESRLTTLLGMGGMGKTRLAQAFAQQLLAQARGLFLDGVWFVELATVTTAAGLLLAIAEAIALQVKGSESAEITLHDHLHEREMLLVLDNFEQLADDDGAVDAIAKLLKAAPTVKLIVTSRERLHLYEEKVVDVGGLADSAELFITYARLQKMTDWRRALDQINIICKQLHHVPLAVELAASWTRERSLRDIATSIADSLDTLATRFRNVPPRHRSVRAAFQTSWDRLDAQTQQHFAALTLFRGGFSAEAARAITQTPLSTLRQLADRSLLIYRPETDRYSLHELLREYAAEQLGDETDLRQVHADFFTQQVQDWFAPLRSERQPEVMGWFSADFSNIEQAWQHHIAHNNRAAIDRCTLPIFTYLRDSSQFLAGHTFFSAALAITDARLAQAAYARFAVELARFEEAGDVLDASIAALGGDPLTSGFMHLQAVALAHGKGQLDDARDLVQLATRSYQLADAPLDRALCEVFSGRIAHRDNDVQTMLRHYEQARQLLEPTGYTRALARIYHGLALAYHYSGNNAEAEVSAKLSIAKSQQIDAKDGIAITNDLLAQVYMLDNRTDEAEACLQSSLAINEQIGAAVNRGITLNNFGLLEQVRENEEAALDYYERSYHALTAQSHLIGAAQVASNVAEVALGLGRDKLADRYLQHALRLIEETGSSAATSLTHDLLARRAIKRGQQAEAAAHLHTAMAATSASRRQFNLLASFGAYLHRFVDRVRGWGVLYYMCELSDAEEADRAVFRNLMAEAVLDEVGQEKAKAFAVGLSAEKLKTLFDTEITP